MVAGEGWRYTPLPPLVPCMALLAKPSRGERLEALLLPVGRLQSKLNHSVPDICYGSLRQVPNNVCSRLLQSYSTYLKNQRDWIRDRFPLFQVLGCMRQFLVFFEYT